jgi:Zn/Cd-binding protein ZinT
MKLIFKLVIFLFILSVNTNVAQNDGMFKQKKERKRVWRKWRSNKGEYNPYLKKTAKDKPSAKNARADKKETRRQKRAFKKELRKTRKKHGIKEPPKK